MVIPVRTKQTLFIHHATLVSCMALGVVCVLYGVRKRGHRLDRPVSPQDLDQAAITKKSQKGFLQKISTMKDKLQQVETLREQAEEERKQFRLRMQKERSSAA